MKPTLMLSATLALLVACGGGESETKTEAPADGAPAAADADPSVDDVKALCAAIIECEACDDTTQDGKVAAVAVKSDWGKQAQTTLQEGDGIGDPARKVLVDKIKETKASDASLDCGLIESFWSE